MARVPKSPLERLVDALKTKRAGERDLYPDLKTLLTGSRYGIGLQTDQVVVDSPSVGGLLAPDLTVFLVDEAGTALRGPDHAFAVIEAKPGHALARPASRQRILEEKSVYVQTGTRFLFLVDQERVIRHDAPLGGPPAEWFWDALKDPTALHACFGPIGPGATRLGAVLSAFRRDGEPHATLRAEGDAERRKFIDTIRTCLRVTADAVRDAVQRLVVRDLKDAEALIADLSVRWGEARYRADRRPIPIKFAREVARGAQQLRPDDLRAFLGDEAQLATDLDGKLYALQIEHELIPFYAQRLGLDVGDTEKRASLLKSYYGKGQKPTPSGRAVETFAYETATLLVSRMLMIRFSEDNGFVKKMISNGGVEAFHAFDAYSSIGFQTLLATSYARARPVYSGLFSESPLDWILDVADERVDQALAHALWMLNRWDFATVDGDVLSGVYDKYLDPARRRALGEVFTRPEIARYLLDLATEGKPQASVLDPACGSGTFVIERLAPHIARLRADNLLAVDTIRPWLERTSGLDINPFSATLARMQVLWHLLDAVRHLPEDQRPRALRALVRAIRVAGGHTSLDTFGIGGANRQGQLDLTFAAEGEATRTTASGLFRTIATDEYDAVVGNPPFVRAQRLAIPLAIRDAYADILRGEADLYVAFVKRALETWVKPGGRLAFILPLPSTVAGYARPMRELVEAHRIVEIVDFEPMRRVMFRGVKRPVVALIVQRDPPTPEDRIRIRVVDPDCYDPVGDVVDLTRASTTEIGRTDFVTLYAPIDLGDDDEAEDAEDEDDAA